MSEQPKRVADVPLPTRQRIGDVLLELEPATDEEMPSLGMAIIRATHLTAELREAGRIRGEAVSARDSALDDLEQTIKDLDGAWAIRRELLVSRR